MDLRLRLADQLIRLRGRIEDMDLDDIQKAREGLPDSTLVTKVFGGMAPGVATHDRTIPGPEGDIPVRIYTPRRIESHRPVVVNLHGGGWVLGTLDGYDWVCSELASRVATTVVSVDYRLAPEHRFPAAVEDSLAAVRWVAEHAEAFGSRTGAVAVMGDSAGGNLTAVVALRLRGSDTSISHQVLVYPATDATLSQPSVNELTDEPILSRTSIDVFLAHYLGPDGDPSHPDMSPLLADDHAGLPPALVQTAEHDPLKDDGAAYAAALIAAGVPVRLTEYVGMVHGFAAMPGLAPPARQALVEIVAFLTDVPGATGATGGGRDADRAGTT